MKGEITKYFDNKGYGFITGEDKETYWFHETFLKEKRILPEEGDKVEFKEHDTPKGKQAREVDIRVE